MLNINSRKSIEDFLYDHECVTEKEISKLKESEHVLNIIYIGKKITEFVHSKSYEVQLLHEGFTKKDKKNVSYSRHFVYFDLRNLY